MGRIEKPRGAGLNSSFLFGLLAFNLDAYLTNGLGDLFDAVRYVFHIVADIATEARVLLLLRG